MKKRHGAEQIAAKLREADVSLGKGLCVPGVCKQLGISEQTYCRRRTRYGGMDPADGQAISRTGTRERAAQEGRCKSGAGHPDPEGGGPPKLLDPERRRRTVDTVRRRLGHDQVLQQAAW